MNSAFQQLAFVEGDTNRLVFSRLACSSSASSSLLALSSLFLRICFGKIRRGHLRPPDRSWHFRRLQTIESDTRSFLLFLFSNFRRRTLLIKNKFLKVYDVTISSFVTVQPRRPSKGFLGERKLSSLLQIKHYFYRHNCWCKTLPLLVR